jgi:Coenzyme PQQ synthesis protein D (PqqD)
MSATSLCIAGHVRASISGDGLVLLDIGGGLVFSANPVGARIWQLLEHRLPLDRIAHQIATEYLVPLDRASRDVEAFVTALSARGLVTREAAQ